MLCYDILIVRNETLCYRPFWLFSLIAAYHVGSTSRASRQAVIIEKRVDTLRIRTPEIVVIHTLGKVQASLPLANDSTDSAVVAMPVQQAVYSDSNYTAYVSGYRPKLDSLIMIKSINTVHFSADNRPSRLSRWSIGLQAGYGITPCGPQPYFGVGIAFRIL